LQLQRVVAPGLHTRDVSAAVVEGHRVVGAVLDQTRIEGPTEMKDNDVIIGLVLGLVGLAILVLLSTEAPIRP
jgi:hypothetical protein